VNLTFKNNAFIIFTGFILLSIALRFLSFQYSVIDHDESTYLVIAQETLDGKTLYVDVWDVKPPGIFLLFAALLKVFGHSICMIRLVAAVFIGLTAGFLFLSLKRWGIKQKHALFAGFSYILFCAVHKWNFAANTEIFFLLFTAIGLFFFSGKKRPANFFLSGLFIGLGFVIKYVVLFDIAAFWLFYVLFFRKEHNIKQLLQNSLAMGLGFIIPYLSVFLYYYLGSNFDTFAFVSFVVPRNYANSFDSIKAVLFFLEFHLIYAPFVFLFILALWKGKNRKIVYFSLIWYVFVWFIVLIPGKFFHHYYFQLLLPLAFLLPEAFNNDTKVQHFLLKQKKYILGVFILLYLSWNIAFQYQSFVKKKDYRREVAKYLNEHLQENETIYCNYSSIIYFLTSTSTPQKYIHPSLLTKQEHIEAIAVDVEEEMRRIVQAEPDYMVIQGAPHPIIAKQIAERYLLQQIIADEVKIYLRKE
jgi:4-amino-4-deoxy-L-arabinose transferase-like glycosyltransferase